MAWVAISLLFNFINAVLWPSDDFEKWYNGIGLCDVEAKLLVAAPIGISISFACILQALAAVLDPERATLTKTVAQKRRDCAIDLSLCLGLPVLQMGFHYVVQSHRYAIQGVSGCAFVTDDSWLTVLLVLTPPAVGVAVDAYFSGTATSNWYNRD